MNQLVLQGPELTAAAAGQIADDLSARMAANADYFTLWTDQNVNIETLRESHGFDINCLPHNFAPENVRLVIMDMDSTLISIECVDEIAGFIGQKAAVADITEAAMRGEIDFETSLRQRVSLLKNIPVSALEDVYQQKLTLNPGALTMMQTLQHNNIRTALVSGGFSFFTERLQQRLGLDFIQANTLAVDNGMLTGEIVGPICGAQAKADFLEQCCTDLGIRTEQTLAMGDGANDLLMMHKAGLSVAYHAKPKVRAQAHTQLNYSGLDGIIGLLQLQSVPKSS